MDLQDESLTRTKKGSPIDRLPKDEYGQEESDASEHPMDADDVVERHHNLVAKYRYELEVQSDNRADMAKDEDYYDNIQFTLAQIQELEGRGQAPISYNVIAQTVNWVIGSEKRGRTDFKILPRGKEDAKPAEVKTKYMKYISDVNRTNFNRSRSFEDAVKVGIGWIETSVEDEEDGEPTGDRYDSWRNILWDSASTAMDESDMRYQFRTKWLDLDIAIAMFPDCEEALRESIQESNLFTTDAMLDGDEAMDGAEAERELFGGVNPIYMYKRQRVRLIEAWYREPEKVKKIKGGRFKGDIFDERDPRHQEAIESGNGKLHEKVVMRTRVMFMTTSAPLYDSVSPFRHNRLKFIPIWGYRRGRDNLPYGIIRGLRDIQDDINKRASKALYILSSNRIIMDEGALPDDMTLDEFADEAARPDAILVKRKGHEMNFDVDRDLSQWHMEWFSRNINMIQQVGGVTDELLGRSTNATSGVAVKARQDQGSVATNKLFDNLRYAVQLHGEITLSLVEQFVTEEKQFRITNQRGTPEYITMNDGLPENDIARAKADFVVSESDWRATMRQAQAEQLLELIAKMPPQVGLVLMSYAVENMDIDNRDELVAEIRKITGQRNPDATEPTPEEIAKEQAAAQQQQAAEAEFMANLRKTESEAVKNEATAEKTKSETLKNNMEAAKAAMEAALTVVQAPTIAKVGDGLLIQGGWTGGTPVPIAAVAAQGMPQQAVQQPPAAEMAVEQTQPQGA